MFFNPFLLSAFPQIGINTTAATTRCVNRPVVSLNYTTLEGASADGVDKFLGISYAQPPVDGLRFRRLQPPLPLSGTTLVSGLVLLCGPPRRLGRGV